MSVPRWNCYPLSRKRVCSPPPPRNQRGGIHSPACEGVGESQFGQLERKLSTLSTLWQQVSEIQRSICMWKRRMEANESSASIYFTWDMWWQTINFPWDGWWDVIYSPWDGWWDVIYSPWDGWWDVIYSPWNGWWDVIYSPWDGWCDVIYSPWDGW